jgi:hypothetical protein
VEKEALRPTIALKWQHGRPDGSIAYEEDLTPEVLIDLFLHGKYLHKGNEKSDKLDAWPLAQVAQQVFFGAMTSLSEVYWVGRNVVAEVLKVPTILNAAPAGQEGSPRDPAPLSRKSGDPGRPGPDPRCTREQSPDGA